MKIKSLILIFAMIVAAGTAPSWADEKKDHICFSVLDANEDGVVTYDEFKKIFGDEKSKFDAVDLDKDGELNHDEYHDNIFDLFPEKTIEYMKNRKIPWIAFKVLAAGAIHPEDAFRYCFENGADFLCVGMFDYQLVDDINIAVNTLNGIEGRERGWYG